MTTSIWTNILFKRLSILGISLSIVTYGINNNHTFHVDAADSKSHKITSWNHNWDCKDPRKLGKKVEIPTAKRNLFLIRHGDYYSRSGRLTKLGTIQAKYTGARLLEMEHIHGQDYKTTLYSSTMPRAVETSRQITLKNRRLKTDYNDDLCEGFPINPEPPIQGCYESSQAFIDGERLEDAFHIFFNRAHPEQMQDSYEIIVCHANVIRFFVCRALQLPPEAWLRFSLNHGSITWLVINPDGRVELKSLSDSAYMPKSLQTN